MAKKVADRKARLNRPSITITKTKINEVERVNKKTNEKVDKMKKENEEMKKMRDDLNAEYDKIANEYFVAVEFTFRTVYVSKSGKVYYGPEEKTQRTSTSNQQKQKSPKLKLNLTLMMN